MTASELNEQRREGAKVLALGLGLAALNAAMITQEGVFGVVTLFWPPPALPTARRAPASASVGDVWSAQ